MQQFDVALTHGRWVRLSRSLRTSHLHCLFPVCCLHGALMSYLRMPRAVRQPLGQAACVSGAHWSTAASAILYERQFSGES